MKAHLVSSAEPLQAGRDQDAACGKQIKKARFVFMWDDMDITGNSLLEGAVSISPHVCRECKLGSQWERYIYGIMSGETESA